MFRGPSPSRHVTARLLSCAAIGLAAVQPVMGQQAPAEEGASRPAAPPLEPQSPLDPMPGLGVDWPDMGQPDIVAPLPAEPAGEEGEKAAAVPPPAGEAPAEEDRKAHAAPPVDYATEQKYRTVLRGLDDVADNEFRERFNRLSALHEGEGKEANVAQINRRARQDQELLLRLLRAKGYYDARVSSEIEPGANGERLQAVLDAVPGGRYALDAVSLPGLDAATQNRQALRDAFPVKPGDPVDADRITTAREGLALALGEQGYPFAKLGEPLIRIDHATRLADLSMDVETGGYRRFGRIVPRKGDIFSGRHLQEIARFRPGDPYNTSDVTDLRRALIATGLVSSARLTPQDAGDGSTVDLGVELDRAPPRTIAGELGYGTGEGVRAEVSWQHRNFFPPEGAMTFRGIAGTQEQSLAAIFRRNNFRKRDQVLNAQISASNVNRAAYDAKTLDLSASLERQTNIIFQKKWIWSVGTEFLASDERDTVGTSATPRRRTFLIAALPASLTYDGSDNLLDPTRGFRLGLRASPELSFQSGTFAYVRTQFDASVYQPMGDRVVLAARTRLGTILGADSDAIAPSRRYYAGGGGSVRGYGYQRIGPRDANDDPIGGRGLAEFSLEARVRLGNFGIVPFIDAGNISTGYLPSMKNLQIGAGLGVRYYSSFGPIRVDVGTPVNRQAGDPRVAVYVSLGQAF